jgi:hypothetical protein
MLRARLTSTSTGGYFLSIKRCLKKHIAEQATRKLINQVLPYLLTYFLTYMHHEEEAIQTQSCKVQVRRNQTTSHVAWLTSNGTC